MKAHTFLKSILLFLCLLSFIGCKKDEPKDEMQIISMSISEETGITYDLFDTNKEYPIECMLVMEEDAPRVWQPMTFGTIKGFTYEKGHSYELKVKRTRLANPPMDASAYTYELVQILEDRIITEPDEPTDTDKEIHSEADIEYQELCPYEKYAINPEEIRIDKAGNLFDANGSALLPYEDKRIYLENILDKADANWNLFNKIPYMAYYAYVFSPLTDEIRLVRVSSGGPMLKNVIPADEYQELLDRVWGEEVMKYSLIIVNIYKQGLQKVEFTVRLK